MIMLTFTGTNATEVKSNGTHSQIAIGAHQGSHYFIIHSAAMERMGMTDNYRIVQWCQNAISLRRRKTRLKHTCRPGNLKCSVTFFHQSHLWLPVSKSQRAE